MSYQAVIFSLAQEEYGIPIESVQEITRLSGIHPVPNSPDYIMGLVSLRGSALPLIDMHRKFGQEKDAAPQFAIIVEINESLIGLAVDEEREVRVFEKVDSPPPLLNEPFIGGIINLEDRIIIQIIPERILNEEEIGKINTISE